MIKTCTFTIRGRLPGMNEIIDVARRNKFMAAKQKKKHTVECAWQIVVQRVSVFKSPVIIDFEWYEPDNRRDIDNVAAGGTKFILDALVETVRIPDDSRKYVRGITHSFSDPDKKNPRIVVTIREAV